MINCVSGNPFLDQTRMTKTRWGWCPKTGKGQQLMVKEAVLVSIFGWQNAKVKSMILNPPLQGMRL